MIAAESTKTRNMEIVKRNVEIANSNHLFSLIQDANKDEYDKVIKF